MTPEQLLYEGMKWGAFTFGFFLGFVGCIVALGIVADWIL